MKKRYYIYLIISLLSIMTTRAAGQSAPDEPTISLSKDTILTGDQVVLNLCFQTTKNQRFALAPYASSLNGDTLLKGSVEVVKEFILDTAELKNGLQELKAKALITSFDSGSFSLPSPTVVVANPKGGVDTLRFKNIILNVNPIQIDTATFKVFDIKAQQTYPITFGQILPWILLAIALILIALSIIRYIKMRRQQKNFFGKSIIKEPPHIVALKKLEKIRGEKLYKHNKAKAYYTAITDALKEYIEKRYGFSAIEKTSAEIMEELSCKEIQKEIYEKLAEMFKTADLVKFAKFLPADEENEGAVLTAVNFVNFAYMQFLSEQEAAGNKKEEGK